MASLYFQKKGTSMYQFFGTFLAGAIAALLMAGLFAAWRGLTHINFDMLRSIGSLFSRRYAFRAGMFIHLILGGLFAFAYVAMWSYLGFPRDFWSLLFGAALGLAHGFIVSFWLVIFVAEHHPLKKFRGDKGFSVALTDIAGHVVYGVVLALFISTLQLNYNWISQMAEDNGVIAVTDILGTDTWRW